MSPIAGNGTISAATVADGEAHYQNSPRALALGALGVVFGDIGTSPLYSIREIFSEENGLTPDAPTLLGILSLIIWSLIVMVSIKFIVLIMQASNKGEGGALALGALVIPRLPKTGLSRRLAIIMAVMGLALFYGDGLVTPAISVMSAIEGLEASTSVSANLVAPLSVIVLIGLFVIQKRGTARVGRLFGPVMILWFITIAALGLGGIIAEPSIMRAINPAHALALSIEKPWFTFVALGSVILTITGGEALYADMGHFGLPPIRHAWFSVVMPALLINYLGQGALLLADPTAIKYPFFHLAPDWAIYPLVALSTVATIIASQAVISGVFSVTSQAIQLGYLPRMQIIHTSESEIGQIYMPQINWLLMIGVVALVLTFHTSDNLAAAYGISVTGTMTIDTILAAMVASLIWRWSPWVVAATFGVILLFDAAFLAAALLKVPSGGWFPLTAALVIGVAILVWRRGRYAVFVKVYRDALPVGTFLERIDQTRTRVAGTAIFMTGSITTVPTSLLHNLKHNKVLHERIVLMTVRTEEVPRVSLSQRVQVERLAKGFYTITACYGFMERPDVPRVLELCRAHGLPIDMMETSFFLSRESLVPSDDPAMPRWQEGIFTAMNSIALSGTKYFHIPANRVVELGSQIEI